METYENKEKAEFNMAVSYLNRLNALFSACDQYSINLDIHNWFHSLLATYRELSTWMKDNETELFNKRISIINTKIIQSATKTQRTGKLEVSQDVYMDLHKMEMDLRRIANKAGLMMKVMDDAMDALK